MTSLLVPIGFIFTNLRPGFAKVLHCSLGCSRNLISTRLTSVRRSCVNACELYCKCKTLSLTLFATFAIRVMPSTWSFRMPTFRRALDLFGPAETRHGNSFAGGEFALATSLEIQISYGSTEVCTAESIVGIVISSLQRSSSSSRRLSFSAVLLLHNTSLCSLIASSETSCC